LAAVFVSTFRAVAETLACATGSPVSSMMRPVITVTESGTGSPRRAAMVVEQSRASVTTGIVQ
jgi:hypothetical protein